MDKIARRQPPWPSRRLEWARCHMSAAWQQPSLRTAEGSSSADVRRPARSAAGNAIVTGRWGTADAWNAPVAYAPGDWWAKSSNRHSGAWLDMWQTCAMRDAGREAADTAEGIP